MFGLVLKIRRDCHKLGFFEKSHQGKCTPAKVVKAQFASGFGPGFHVAERCDPGFLPCRPPSVDRRAVVRISGTYSKPTRTGKTRCHPEPQKAFSAFS
jgi:hypothetical protein